LAEFLSSDEINSELDELTKVEDVDAGAQQAPLNSLSDAAFELLLWDVFGNQIHSEEYYDTATLMVVGADQGRDVWLTKNGNPGGLIQCKRLKSAFGAPDAIREIIKFILFAELNPNLLQDDQPFRYSLAVSTEPAGTTVDFFASPTQWLTKHEDKILGYLNEVIGKYKSFEKFSGAKKLNQVKRRLELFSYELLRPADIDVLLGKFPRVRERFFRIRLVQSEEDIDDFMGRMAGKHGLGQPIGDKARALLDVQLHSEIEGLRKSRFYPGNDVAKPTTFRLPLDNDLNIPLSDEELSLFCSEASWGLKNDANAIFQVDHLEELRTAAMIAAIEAADTLNAEERTQRSELRKVLDYYQPKVRRAEIAAKLLLVDKVVRSPWFSNDCWPETAETMRRLIQLVINGPRVGSGGLTVKIRVQSHPKIVGYIDMDEIDQAEFRKRCPGFTPSYYDGGVCDLGPDLGLKYALPAGLTALVLYSTTHGVPLERIMDDGAHSIYSWGLYPA
jgi:hypothetical protein